MEGAPNPRWPRLFHALAGLIAVLTATLALRPRALVALWPILEDAFYSFAVARHVALGRGISADGVSPTNGFQPLFTFLTVPAFAVAGGDLYLPIRLILALQWLFYLGTAIVLARIASALADDLATTAKAWAPAATAFLYLANPLAYQAHFSGLETGCALFFYGVTWRYTQTRRFEALSEQLALGGLLGLTVLARVDAAFFVVAVCVCLFWTSTAPFAARLRPPLVVTLVAAAVSSPWWLYNWLVFGSLLPSSGAAQQEWAVSLPRTGAALLSLVRTVTPWWSRFDPGRFDRELAGDGVRVGLFFLGAFWLWRRREVTARGLLQREDGRWVLRPAAWAGAALLVATLGLLVWYAVSSFAFWFYGRYLSPLLLISTLVLSRALVTVATRHPWPALAAVLVLARPVPYDTLVAFTRPVEKGNIMFTDQLPLVLSRVPEGECVGALQSGTLGYFRECVVNLDGKINGEALRRRRDIWAYLDERGVRWLCDWPSLFRFYFGGRPEDNGWEPLETRNKFVLYRRRDPRS